MKPITLLKTQKKKTKKKNLRKKSVKITIFDLVLVSCDENFVLPFSTF